MHCVLRTETVSSDTELISPQDDFKSKDLRLVKGVFLAYIPYFEKKLK
jgi:hypothetical protein